MANAAREAATAKRTNVGGVKEGCIGTGVRVGFHGCHVLDRPVRFALRDHDDRRPAAYPRVADFDCPCGNHHRGGVMWRNLNEGEELNAEVLI